ncbi:MAG: aquaporin [Methyloceanibacter sp.]
MNAARSIGPAIVGFASDPHSLAQVWVFIVVPLVGACAAGYLFKSGILAADRALE